jgi:hypothetical protein
MPRSGRVTLTSNDSVWFQLVTWAVVSERLRIAGEDRESDAARDMLSARLRACMSAG